MSVTIKITSQYYENYSDTDTPYWKSKMGQEFIVEGVSSDAVMYADDLVAVLTEIVANQSDDHNKYEYLSHEVEFSKPIKIDSEVVVNAIREQFSV